MSLNPRQQRFVDEYLIDLNATAAAIRAGYSPKTARAIGAENLTKPDIAEAIRERKKKISEKVEITQEWVVTKLRENLERSMQPESYNGAVANKALELLGKHVGMFSDMNIRTPDGPVEITIKRQVVPAATNRIAQHTNGNGNGNGKSKH
jgi:phage terminase small subunit